MAKFEPGMYREHYDEFYAGTGNVYDYYMPAYGYGHALAYDDEYSDYHDWNDIQTDARRGWEENNPDSAWEDVKDSIRHAWEEVKGALDTNDND